MKKSQKIIALAVSLTVVIALIISIWSFYKDPSSSKRMFLFPLPLSAEANKTTSQETQIKTEL